jgi:hypothetical protein
MNKELTKSLTDLIDETLMELEELKKSRFSAEEIELKGPGEGLAGKPSNGKLDAEKAEDDKDEDEDEDKDMDKGENEKADPDHGHHKMDKSEMCKKCGKSPCKCMDKAENAKADPDAGHHKMDKSEDKKDKDEDKDEDKKDKDAKGGEEHESEERKAIGKLAGLAGMKKSQEEMSSLMKSYIDERVGPLEDKLSTLLNLVNKIADQPVAPRGVSARVAPLFKSADENAVEPLSKAQIASKLFELKKSGSAVDSLDVTKAEMGQDLESITKKYKLS